MFFIVGEAVKPISIEGFAQYGRDCLFISSPVGSFNGYVHHRPSTLYCRVFDSPVCLLVISNIIRAATIYPSARSGCRIGFWVTLDLVYCIVWQHWNWLDHA